MTSLSQVSLGLSTYSIYLNNANMTYNSITLTTLIDQESTNDVRVYVNGVKAICNVTDTFRFTIDVTPEISSILPNNFGDQNTTFTISGSKFSNDVSKIQVTIGTEICELVSSNLTSISCVLPRLNLGAQYLNVLVNSKLIHIFNSLIH